MRYILLILIALLTLIFAGCSWRTAFVVVNESSHPVEVRYKIKRFPYSWPLLTAKPETMDASRLGDGQTKWKELCADEYQVDQENRIITASVMPHEALWITNMSEYFGDDDPIDAENWPIEEISVDGDDGGMTFRGQKARKSFSYVSHALYTLEYK
jgi:hypothetical protein